jgi:hypothetical protein
MDVVILTRTECEKAIRALSREFMADPSKSDADRAHPSFSKFKAWLDQKGYTGYLRFRARIGADMQAELWFDDELEQSWRQ